MKYLFHVCLFMVVLRISAAYWIVVLGISAAYWIVVLRLSAAYWIDSNEYMSNPAGEDEALSAISSVKRYKKACMRWGMVCVPESRYGFAQCCSGLNCVCNLWNSHCKCRVKLG